MGKIHQLSSVLANQIAAGEVIERPSSIVKELVENALDAHSHRIDVVVTEAGLGSIRVIDDGDGIARSDVPMAFKRHATSKIESARDLFRVQTMGFRGEALPSIASVADVIMTTATKGQEGTAYHIRGGVEKSLKPAIARQGTDILVTELFYNTPARLKYLKSPKTELSHLVDIVNRLALANPDVAISFTHDGREMFRSAGNGRLQQVIAAIDGVNVGRGMIPVQGENPDFRISGYISRPELTRAQRSHITLTINHRYVRSYALTKAIIAGYQSKLMVGRFPLAVINIDLDPVLVDVNVHPAKREVRLSKEDQLASLLEQAVYHSLANQNLIPDAGSQARQLKDKQKAQATHFAEAVPAYQTADEKAPAQATPPTVTAAEDDEHQAAAPVVIKERQDLTRPAMAAFDQRYQNESQVPPFEQPISISQPTKADVKTEEMALDIDDAGDQENQRFPDLQYLAQYHGTFLLAQASDGLYLVDQHAAQERINFERFRHAIGEVGHDQQAFLTPLVLSFSTAEALKISEHLDILNGVDLHLEPFGQNSFVLSEHPTWFVEGQEEATAKEMIDWILSDTELSVAHFRLKTAMMMSCKRAIKANHHLDNQQAKALLERLAQCQNPFNCPHGRPVTIRFTDTDLEKLFKRIQDHHQAYSRDFDAHSF
ncbi:DNA mismatch repair endonuclease MutL [Limosilactobacillus mucosae]|uniref:DNA mismatch repair endonuclease MutL n=1 Tax=Limosilactobacillus mucosae TaxID=97478 RepID=UPI0022E87072|nr:DNA mismatch repair endonuclease MutL [Limosilactobacillus mucosae]